MSSCTTARPQLDSLHACEAPRASPPTATGSLAGAVLRTNGTQTLLPDCLTNDSCLRFDVSVTDIVEAHTSHIHCGLPGDNGGIGLTLYDDVPFSAVGIAPLASGLAAAPDAANLCGWQTITDVAGTIRAGEAYIDVHTSAFPAGEVRGQVVSAP